MHQFFFKDVPYFVKDVPNFVNNVPNFVNDVRRLPKSVPRWGMTSNHFPRVSKGRNYHGKGERCPVNSMIRRIKFFKGCTYGSKVRFEVGKDSQSLPKYP